MDRLTSPQTIETPKDEAESLPPYEPPRMVTYRGSDILEQLGPAHASNSQYAPSGNAPILGG